MNRPMTRKEFLKIIGLFLGSLALFPLSRIFKSSARKKSELQKAMFFTKGDKLAG